MIDALQRLLGNTYEPTPRNYGAPMPPCWAALDRTLRTLPSHFDNINVNIQYQDLAPPPSHPFIIHATIRIIHPELRYRAHEIIRSKQGDLASAIVLDASFNRESGNTIMSTRFTYRRASYRFNPLVVRISSHILDQTDKLLTAQFNQ